MTPCIRALCQLPCAAFLSVVVMLTGYSPARADLSNEQKDKIRAVLPAPQMTMFPTAGFSSKGGFDLKITDQDNSELKKARLESFLSLPSPDGAINQLQYFRTLGDMQRVLRETTANDTYDKGEKLALSLTKTGAPYLRARFLALAGGFHADQDEYKEAEAVVGEALKLNPDSWEAWDVQAQLCFQKVHRLLNRESVDMTDVDRWLGSSPTPEAVKQLLDYTTEALAAADKAVALEEKSVPKPEDRKGSLYFSRIVYRAFTDMARQASARQDGDKPVSSSEIYKQNVYSDGSIGDMEKAAACEPNNPYAIIAYRLTRATKAGTRKGAEEQSKIALTELSRLEQKRLPDRETRARLLEAQVIFSGILENWSNVVTKAKQGVALAPGRESFTLFYPAGLLKQEKYAEAEKFASEQVARNDNTVNRAILARAQMAQNDFFGAERTLEPVYESNKSTVFPAIFLATIRLKTTSANTSDAEWLELRDFIQEIGAKYKSEISVSRNDALSYYMVVATYNALNGKEDDARAILQRVIDADAENKAAKSMLALLP